MPDEAEFSRESCMDFKKIWRNMAETDPPVGMLTFFKQALIDNLKPRQYNNDSVIWKGGDV